MNINSYEVNTDISLRDTSSELRNYKAALDACSIVAITNRAGTISYVNDMFCKISGYSRNELIGKTHKIVNSGYHSAEFFTDLWTTVMNGDIWRGDICNRKSNGDLYWVATVIVPFKDHMGATTQYLSIRTDITHAKKHEREVTRHMRELEVSNNKLEMANSAKNEFLQVASHELRTPLTIIKEFSSLLKDEIPGKNTPDQQECAESIYNNCDRLKKLIDNILDLQKMDSDRVQIYRGRVLLTDLLQEIHHDFTPTCNSNCISLSLEIPEQRIEILCDNQKIVQLIVNLIGNSLKFTPSGGKITIGANLIDDTVEIYVSDNGKGICVEDQKNIFNKFTQLERNSSAGAKGTGLGLSISHKIARLHESDLEVESNLGEGATFRFRLPVYSLPRILMTLLSDTVRNANNPLQEFFFGLVRIQSTDIAMPFEKVASEMTKVLRRDVDNFIIFPEYLMIAIVASASEAEYEHILNRTKLFLSHQYDHDICIVSANSPSVFDGDVDNMKQTELSSLLERVGV